jgi:leader peptidase (prepilin peptidase)/N-methyltransferase
MSEIFPYVIVGLAGYLVGGAVNFIVEWLYLHREAYTPEQVDQIKTAGWPKYLAWPFSTGNDRLWQKSRILVIELFFTTAAIWLWFLTPEDYDLWWRVPLLVYFSIVIVMDLEYRVVIHEVSFAGAVLGLVVGFHLWGVQETLIGGVIGYLVMYLFYKLGEVFVRWVSRRRGEELDEVALGFGDVNLSGVVGLCLGKELIIQGLFFAIFAGGFVSILFVVFSVLLRRFRAFAALPYAPFLALAALVMLFFPNEVSEFFSSGDSEALLFNLPVF